MSRPAPPAGPPAGSLAALPFVRVPPPFARYELDLGAAARILGVEPDRAAELTAALPRSDRGDGPRLDYYDVVNLAMFDGTTRQSIPDLALRFLLRFAASPEHSWYRPMPWLVRVRVPAPVTGALTVRTPDLDAPGVSGLDPADLPAGLAGAAIDPPGYQVGVRLTGARDAVHDRAAREAYRELLDALDSGAVVYQAVSEGLRMEHRRAWALGMADCVVVSRLLADRLRGCGLAARARRGYLLGLIGSDHAWCEVYEDGRWKPMDVVFAFLAGGGGGTRSIAAAPRFAQACCGSRFNRLLPCRTPEAEPLVHLDGDPVPPWSLVGVSAHTWAA